MANHLKAITSAVAAVASRCPNNAAAPIEHTTGMANTAATTTAAKTGRARQWLPSVVSSPTAIPSSAATRAD
jgi:hypothetical protein